MNMRSEWAEDPTVQQWNLIMEDVRLRAAAAFDGLELVKLEYPTPESDPVSMPDHYTKLPVECIDITEHFSFTLGNVIKYVWRADFKGKPIEDLKKARWYFGQGDSAA